MLTHLAVKSFRYTFVGENLGQESRPVCTRNPATMTVRISGPAAQVVVVTVVMSPFNSESPNRIRDQCPIRGTASPAARWNSN